jgi:ribosomal protein L30E
MMKKDDFHLHVLKQTRPANITQEDLKNYRKLNEIPTHNESGTPVQLAVVDAGKIVLLEE